MKSVHFDRPGPPEVLFIRNSEIPIIKDTEILIKVKFAGVNRPDIIQREGNYPAPNGHSPILGLEVSGIVYKVGAKVKDFKKGDEVAALVNGGGYAEYCATDQLTTFKIPKNVSLKEAAGIPECFFTVWSNLIISGKLKKNKKVLIHWGGKWARLSTGQEGMDYRYHLPMPTTTRTCLLQAVGWPAPKIWRATYQWSDIQ